MPTLVPPVIAPGVVGLEGDAGGEVLGAGVGDDWDPATAALWLLNMPCPCTRSQTAVGNVLMHA